MRRVVLAGAMTLLLLGLSGCERYALDRQMEELCKKDGGIRVYETVTLPASHFEPDGRLLTGEPTVEGVDSKTQELRYRQVGNDEYRIGIRRQVLSGSMSNPNEGSGRLIRLHWTIFHRLTSKVLGEQVEYRRVGGDGFTFGFQPSSSSCPAVQKDVSQIVFLKGN
jgi:hypothetical protein